MPFQSAASYHKNCKQFSLFKQAIVTPLLKKSGLDPNDLKNFRPVSNLPFISKILEKVVLTRQLQKHLSENELFEIKQSAYRKNHCTETAPEQRELFTILVIRGSRSERHSLVREVGIGSNMQVLVGNSTMSLRISSSVTGLERQSLGPS